MSSYKILNRWLSISPILFPRFILLNVNYLLATFGNTSKVDTKETMNENKKEKN